MAADEESFAYRESMRIILCIAHLYKIFVYSGLEHINTISMQTISIILVKNPYIRAQTSRQLTASDPIRTTYENIAIYCGELPVFRKKNKGQ